MVTAVAATAAADTTLTITLLFTPHKFSLENTATREASAERNPPKLSAQIYSVLSCSLSLSVEHSTALYNVGVFSLLLLPLLHCCLLTGLSLLLLISIIVIPIQLSTAYYNQETRNQS